MKHTGLTAAQVEESRTKHGENTLTPPPRTPLWKLYFEKFNDPIIRILLIAVVLSLALSIKDGHYAETIGIMVAIFLATGVSFFFEMDAAKKFDVLNKVNDETKYKVYRDGEIVEVGKRELVVGDVVILDTGEEIPADGLLLECTSLSINESTLTGEPIIKKTTDEAEFKKDATYASNALMRGTSVVEGNAVMRIEKVGDATEFGKVAHEATVKTDEPTPLSRQLDRLAKMIGVIGFAMAFITFIALMLKDVVRMTASGEATGGQIALLLGVVLGGFMALGKVWIPIIYDARELLGSKKSRPERFAKTNFAHWLLIGLMTFGAVAMAGIPFGVQFWATEHWLSIEQAGRILNYFMVAVTLIVVAVPEGLPMSVTLSLALSMRKMLKSNNLVRKMHASETMGATTVICTDKTGTLTRNQMNVSEVEHFHDDRALLHKAIAVNSTAHLDAAGAPLGNPTEGALLLWLGGNQGVDYNTLRTDIVEQIPFSSKAKMMTTRATFNGTEYRFVKGAPEYVLAQCEGIDRASVEAHLLEYQNRAMRTLAFAVATGDEPLKLQAIMGISDPVRDDVPAAVADCMSAGVGIKIVTGDTPATAREIARQIGLWLPTDGPINEITGPDWEALSDDEAYERAAHLKIMARARPMDKQRLVKLLQKRGEVVAVTGDGTNDAPALNFANVGLSMGTGTSVAKEASDITLLDDSFASISRAVMWGRSVYINIQRFVMFQLTINVAALTVVFLGSLLGFDLPLTVTQMLWVNLIMDTFAAGALASLPPDPNVMKDRPRGLGSFIISPYMSRSILTTGFIFVALLIGLLFWFAHTGGEFTTNEKAQFFTIFVMLQLWNMFNAKAYRSGHSAFHGLLKSPAFLCVAGIILVGQVLIVSFGGAAFSVEPLSLYEWIIITAATFPVLLIGELIRYIKLKAKNC